MGTASVSCWGNNTWGQLSDGSVTSAFSLSSSSTSLHACAVLTGGNVACWGFNAYGQLGNLDVLFAGALYSVYVSFATNCSPEKGRRASVSFHFILCLHGLLVEVKVFMLMFVSATRLQVTACWRRSRARPRLLSPFPSPLCPPPRLPTRPLPQPSPLATCTRALSRRQLCGAGAGTTTAN